MVDINKMVDGYSGTTGLSFNFRDLFQLIEEALEQPPLLERSAPEAKKTTFTVSMIPDIEVSELGWSDIRTPDQQGAAVGRTEREILQAYLDNIGGPGGIATLPEKLSQLSGLADNPAQFVKSLQGSDKSAGSKIKTVFSFLVFYKTLTKIISNFNASSAGFSFESFLATLLGGQQIPAAGASTIADFTDADGEKISLKLYAEKTVEVGGSFDALVGDLIKNGKMTYLVVTKDIRGNREKLAGTLTFYQFDFTLDNVMDILKDSKAFSARCIILPTGEEGEIVDVEVPEKIRVDFDKIQTLFKQNLAQNLKCQELADEITSNPHFVYGTDEMLDIATGSGTIRPYATPMRRSDKKTAMEQELRSMPSLLDVENLQPIVAAVYNSLYSILQDIHGQRSTRRGQVAEIVPSFGIYTLPGKADTTETQKQKINNIKEAAYKSADIYRELDEEGKKRALLKTNGYLNDLQFALNKTEIIELAQAQGGPFPTGKIKIGTEHLQVMLDSCIAALNTDIFSIFSDLETLSDSLNTFFAGGLTDTDSADNAIKKANSIEGKTTEIKSEK